MKIKIITSICFLLLNATLQAAEILPQGRWTVEKISIEKNTDGIVQTAVYKTAAEVISHIACPHEWEINEKSIVLRYPDGKEETIPYDTEGNRFTITIDGLIQSYQYSISGENLTLSASYNYVNNLASGHTERIEEKRIITLKK